MPKDHGVEQGDVNGPLECSLAPGMVVAEVRLCFAAKQAARTLSCIGTRDSLHERQLQDEQHNRMQQIRSFQLVGSGNFAEPMTHDILCKKRGLADQWYLDDGDILRHPLLVPPIFKRSTFFSFVLFFSDVFVVDVSRLFSMFFDVVCFSFFLCFFVFRFFFLLFCLRLFFKIINLSLLPEPFSFLSRWSVGPCGFLTPLPVSKKKSPQQKIPNQTSFLVSLPTCHRTRESQLVRTSSQTPFEVWDKTTGDAPTAWRSVPDAILLGHR